MKFTEDLAAIHAYLCADGYVVKNPKTQKHKYYHIGLRNTNETLLKDFQKRFYNYFRIKPHIYRKERCRIGSKQLFEQLTKDYSYYSYEWTLPKLSKNHLNHWLRAFFDCEGWVECQKAKSRLIGLESVNHEGLAAIKTALAIFDINSTIKNRKGRTTKRLTICGLDNLKRFHATIGFLHPKKRKKLDEALASYTLKFLQSQTL